MLLMMTTMSQTQLIESANRLKESGVENLKIKLGYRNGTDGIVITGGRKQAENSHIGSQFYTRCDVNHLEQSRKLRFHRLSLKGACRRSFAALGMGTRQQV